MCVAEGEGTRVLADYEGDVAGWLRLVALLPTFVLRRILLRDFRGLSRVLDAEERTVAAVPAGISSAVTSRMNR